MAALYPIGIQTFEEIVSKGMTYVDKTALVYQLTHGVKSNFLSRPRRFGKSLLVTTLQAYFEGRKDLFQGLAMEQLEHDWEQYPVIHIDLSRSKYYSIENVKSTLHLILTDYETKYGIGCDTSLSCGNRLDVILKTAHKITGKQVVVLIDEYDAPMLDSLGNESLQRQIKAMIRDFYSPLKANEGILRFVFFTGITKFAQLSIFSELNNIANLSMKDEFSAICGITKQELAQNFAEGIAAIAKQQGISHEAVIDKLGKQYDGYRFSPNGPHIYNPYSLLNAFFNKDFQNYWFATGTPTFLLELLKKNKILATQLEGIMASPDRFDQPTEEVSDAVPVLYQGGYITIKHYEDGMFMLGFPNNEVREGFNNSLLRYVAPHYQGERDSFAWTFRKAMNSDDIDTALEALQVFLAGFPYDLHMNSEKQFQAIIYTVFETLNFTIQSEARTAKGRVDILVQTAKSVFVMELKINKSAQEALSQINEKSYALPWKLDNRKLFKVGINFSTKERTVNEWKYEEC